MKLEGEFVWHTHDDTDELFLVTDGRVTIQLRTGDVSLGPGQLFVVPRGVEHCPVASGEVRAILIEPAGRTSSEVARSTRPRCSTEVMKLPVLPPVAPMLAQSVPTIPRGAAYEPKWDGSMH